MKLNDVQRLKLRDLGRDPVFASILEEAQSVSPVPRWKPKGDEIEKHHRWIYQSGFVDGVDHVVKLLRNDYE